MMYGWGGYGGGYGMGIFMIVFWLAALGILGFGIYGLIRWADRGGARQDVAVRPADNALAILKERYARGEITKEEFDKMKVDLQA